MSVRGLHLSLCPGYQVLGTLDIDSLDLQRLLLDAALSRSHRACAFLSFKSQEEGMAWGSRSSLGAVLET